MSFWTYMLHCRAGKYYTGHTDDLERRIGEHQSGQVQGFTKDKLPVELVWSQEFPTRHEALAAELQIKGWSRAKKQALIRGDWDRISALAKSKDGPSTSSGRTVEMVEKTAKSVRAEPVEAPSFSSQNTLIGKTCAPARLDKALADATDLSRARVQALIAQGRVVLDGQPANSPSAKIASGTPFAITILAAIPAEAQPQDIPLDIAYEDQHLIIVNKPAGMVVHPAAGNADGTLVNALLHHCKGSLSGIGGVARPGIVHRIDKDTSGLLVAAKTDAAHEGLAAQFAAHTVHRRYLAVCAGFPTPKTGTIEGKIGRSDANRKKMAVLDKNSSRGKHAVTHYTVLDRLADASLIECRLETGRTHQVRVHCASIGHALLGDPFYGQTPKALKPLLKQLGFARQALHAAEIGFNHPVTRKNVHFQASLPPDILELIDELTRCNR